MQSNQTTHQRTKTNSIRQKKVNNEDNTGDSSQEIDKNEGQSIPEKVKKKDSPSYNLEGVKSHEEFREESKSQRENQSKYAKPNKISKNSSSLSIKGHKASATVIPNAKIIQTTKTDNTTALLKSPEASIVSSKRDEDIQTKHVGFKKQSYRQHKLSRIPSAHLTHKELTNQNEINTEYDHKESSQIYTIDHDQAVLPSKMHRGSNHTETSEQKQVHEHANRASIQSQKATYTPSPMKLAAHKKPGSPHEPLVPVQSAATLDLPSIEGVSTLFKTYEAPEPVTADKASKPTEKTLSRQKTAETVFTEGLSEQTLYVRVTKKLPSNGPISIYDLDDFLKKSKMDFEHFYYRKPISSLQITDFNLMKTLGVGAFGKVVLAELKKDKTLYAVKIIDKVGVVKRNHVRYVSNEKRILQALNFPFVVNLKYFFTDFYYLYFVMPYISGGTFYRHLKIVRKIKESEATFYIGQLILALEYLHYLELIHRDVKTENVMIDAFGYLKLVDFGQCIRCYSNDKTWTFTGTPDYMAPEIIVGKGYDCAVDWWALGIITFEICAGFRPFREENPQKLQLLILCNQYSIPSSFSRSLKKLIENLLVLEPKKRIANYSKKASMLKKHAWFKGLDWLALLNRTLEAPFLPNLQKSSQLNPSQQKDQEK